MATLVNPQNANHKVDTAKIVSYSTADIHNAKISVGAGLTEGSANIVINSHEVASVKVGMTVTGNGIPSSTIVNAKNGTTVTLSNAATISGGSSLNIGDMVYVLSLDMGGSQYRFDYTTSGARSTAVGTIGF